MRTPWDLTCRILRLGLLIPLLAGCAGPISVLKSPATPLQASRVFVTVKTKDTFTIADAQATGVFYDALRRVFAEDGLSIVHDSEEADIALVATQLDAEYRDLVVRSVMNSHQGEETSRSMVVTKIVYDIQYHDRAGRVLSRIHLKGFYGGFSDNVRQDAEVVREFSRRVFVN